MDRPRIDGSGVSELTAALEAADGRARALRIACEAAQHRRGGDALDGILEAALNLAQSASIYASSPADPSLWLLIGHRGEAGPDVRTVCRYGEALVGEVAAAGPLEPPRLLSGALALPIVTDNDTVAVLRLDRTSGPAFSTEDLEAAAALGALSGQVFKVGQLERDIQNLLGERSFMYRLARSISEADSLQPLLDLGNRSLLHLLSARAGLLYLLPHDAGQEGLVSAEGVAPGVMSSLAPLLDRWMSMLGHAPMSPMTLTQPELRLEASLLDGQETPSSLLLAGITVAGRLIGAAGFERVVAVDGPYSVADGDLLAGTVGQLGTVVENVRLRSNVMSAFRDLSQFYGAGLTVEEICERILGRIHTLFPGRGCWLVTMDRADGSLRLRASLGFRWRDGVNLNWLSADNLASIPSSSPGVWIIDSSQIRSELPWSSRECPTVAVASIQAQDGYAGAIVLALRSGQDFTIQQQLLLASLASQSGLVIRSAELMAVSQELVIQKERSRIAREIHDGVAQNLALLMLKMEVISRLAESDPRRMKAEMEMVTSILESSVGELRRSIYALRSPDLSRLGLRSALTRLADDFTEQARARVDLAVPSALSLPSDAQSAAYSVVQERLDALVRQGTATRVSIDVAVRRTRLMIRLRDDARTPPGFPSVDHGLASSWRSRMEKRVQPLAGSVRVSRSPGQTCVTISIPLKGTAVRGSFGTKVPAT